MLLTLLMLNATFFAVVLLSGLTFQGGLWVCAYGKRYGQRYAAERHQAFSGCTARSKVRDPSPCASNETVSAFAADVTQYDWGEATCSNNDSTAPDSLKRPRSPAVDHDALFDEFTMENKLSKSTVNHALMLCKKGLDLSKVSPGVMHAKNVHSIALFKHCLLKVVCLLAHPKCSAPPPCLQLAHFNIDNMPCLDLHHHRCNHQQQERSSPLSCRFHTRMQMSNSHDLSVLCHKKSNGYATKFPCLKLVLWISGAGILVLS